MSISHGSRCIALALLLPLYIRSVNLFEFTLHAVSVIVAIILHLYFYNKDFRFDTGKSILIALAWCWCANQIADLAVQGEWKRLVFAYLVSLDGVGCLLPGSSNIKTRLSDLRAHNPRAPILAGPMVIASGVATLLIGSYNDGGNTSWLIFDILMVGCVLAVALQQLGMLVLNARTVDRGLVQETILDLVNDAMSATNNEAAATRQNKSGRSVAEKLDKAIE
ncbi:hypothetical protein BDV96DRAFT_642442 [Lophiotrema nucula]|uniref:Uncharacterized protein n=1 Tax=Lophiotrema nucula TaxID=690887 RepID=A0A6A5ZKN2_9PLEO|nr:hypothetical protein BDV96DRAFT_642442 [Lophiotrema nucula]